ncbi:spore coat protein U-like protein [Novosphingobium sp. SG919]|nr:spore coat protein U-like protein [Novosphingobium sp. SG919]
MSIPPGSLRAEPLNVSVQVPLDCEFDSGASGGVTSGLIDFGTTGAVAGQRVTAIGTVYVRCNLLTATPYVRLDYGQNASGTQRRLIGPSGFLVPYELRMGSAAAALWDDQPHSIGYGTTFSQALPIYGVIASLPAGLPDGGYTDLVHLQLDY